MKKLTIEIKLTDKDGQFTLATEGMHQYEILGILRAATILQENRIKEQNI
ncbi:hypothetical protein [Maribacter sp.]|nr:hypothetical protein [Maribacter sp.]